MHTTQMIALLSIVVVVVPLSLLGVGIWLVLRELRGGAAFPACGKCGYDVTGSIGSAIRCPECGCAFAEVGIHKPSGRHRPALIVVSVVLIVASVGCLGTGIPGLMGLRGVAQAQAQARAAKQAAVQAQAQAQALAARHAAVQAQIEAALQAAVEAATTAEEAAESDDDEPPEPDPSG